MATPSARQTSAILAISSRHMRSTKNACGIVVRLSRLSAQGLRPPIVDVEVHFGRDVADYCPGCGNSNYDMKVLYGCLAGQDEVGAALRTRRFIPSDFSSSYHGSCSIEAAARRSTEASGTGGGKRL